MAKECPECGESVEGWNKAALQAHATHHWADLEDKTLSPEGRRRRKALLAGGGTYDPHAGQDVPEPEEVEA